MKLRALLSRWVEFCEHRPKPVLAMILVLAAATAVYVAANFSIDSDLSKLIRPSDELAWYQANEHFKESFPDLQQTSVVVVSGPALAAVDETARGLTRGFRESQQFEFVFAPSLTPSKFLFKRWVA